MIALILLLSLWLQNSASENHSLAAYYRWEEDLLSSYKPHLRPVYDPATATNVSVEMFVISIQNLDETQQTLRHVSYLRVTWKDQFLTWNPSDYMGISFMDLPTNMVWIPDLSISNSAAGNQRISDSELTLTVSHTGDVRWGPFGMLETSCSMSIVFYPFDTQICPVKVYVASNSDAEVNLTNITVMKGGDFVENSEWQILGFDIKKDQKDFSSGPFNTTYPLYSVSLKLERRRLFYSLTLLTPNVLLALLAALVFALPAECGEKMSFSMSLLLAFAVNLSVLMTAMPRSSLQFSLLMIYLTALSLVTALSVMTSVYLLRLYHRADYPKGPVIGPKLASTIFCLQNVFNLHVTGGTKKPASDYILTVKDDAGNASNDVKMLTPSLQFKRSEEADLGISDKTSPSSDNDRPVLKWRDVAVTLDYIFFRSFTCLIVGMTCALVLTLFISSNCLDFFNNE